VVEAPPIADNVTVDARNLAILFSLRKYPPPEFKVPPNTLDNFSYEGIVLALKNWQGILTFVQAGVTGNPVIPGYLYHCGYTAGVYRVAEAVVDMYSTAKFAELVELHNQLTAYVTRAVDDKTAYVMPSILVGLLQRIPLDTVWLKTHPEGSNCPDVENNLLMSAAMQVTAYIFGVPFKPASITTYVMQRPIAFTDAMKEKDIFKPFASKWGAAKNTWRALEYTERKEAMVPTLRPPDDSSTRLFFTYHGGALPHLTPPLADIVPYDSQCDPSIVSQSWRAMGKAVACRMQPHNSSSPEQTQSFMMPVMETNSKLFQTFVKGFQGVLYTSELITKEEKSSSLAVSTIDRRIYQMMFGDIPLPLDG